MKKITELKNVTDNLTSIKSLSDEEQYQWYLRIKESLPKLQGSFSTVELESLITEYERRHGIV